MITISIDNRQKLDTISIEATVKQGNETKIELYILAQIVVKEIGETAMKQNIGHIGNIEPETKQKILLLNYKQSQNMGCQITSF